MATAFMQWRVYALTIFFLAIIPPMVKGFPGLDLSPLRAGGVPFPSMSFSFLWPLALPILGLLPPQRNGGKE
jgi:hypothetical protein